eukprot:TRINITY_DN37621_c0_g1_i1.p1 TRINITY_DN37621_c0_g1~~TRINITY_DN37621_c0_g1_i1.p1  ORF type:complete len:817 (-),score=184.57 TRINITY_DN37621_c0_g1_i1:362-2728(-)
MIRSLMSKFDFDRRRRSVGECIDAGEVSDENENSSSSTTASSCVTWDSLDAIDGEETISVPVSVVVRCRPACGSQKSLIELQTEITRTGVSLQISASETRQSHASLRNFRCNTFLGPHATQAEVFQQAAPLVEHVVAGYNATMICYGAIGSGKTFTMSGPPGRANDLGTAEAGVAQRTCQKIFEYVRAASTRGETFSIEASFLEIHSSDGKREQLIDRLSKENRKLEVKRDPCNPSSFYCDGLTSQPIRSPNDICKVLNRRRQSCTFTEASRNVASSRAHCILMLTVESIAESFDSEPIVKRGKLMLVDMTGLEHFKKGEVVDASNKGIRAPQAIGSNRIVSSLGAKNSTSTSIPFLQRDSMLSMLLHDCLCGNARALIVANIAPELGNFAEVIKTLNFAQQMTSVRRNSLVDRNSQEQSSIVQLRKRHVEALRILEDASQEEEEQEMSMQVGEEMGHRVLTRESGTKTLAGSVSCDRLPARAPVQRTLQGSMSCDRLQKIEDLTAQMAASMLRHQNPGDMDEPRQVDQLQKQSEEHEAMLRKISAEHDETKQLYRGAEQEANALKVKLAFAEERAEMLQARLDELQRERSDSDQDKRSMKQQLEQLWERVVVAEGSLHKCRTENEVLTSSLERLTAAQRENVKVAQEAKRERDAAEAREEELQRKNMELWKEVAEAKREHEIATCKLETEKKEAVTWLERQIERMMMRSEVRKEQMTQLQQSQVMFKVEREQAQKEKDAELRRVTEQLTAAHKALNVSESEKTELLQLLDEMESSMRSKRASRPSLV